MRRLRSASYALGASALVSVSGLSVPAASAVGPAPAVALPSAAVKELLAGPGTKTVLMNLDGEISSVSSTAPLSAAGVSKALSDPAPKTLLIDPDGEIRAIKSS